MKVKPKLSYELLGTNIKLSKDKEYEAEWATNQPNWMENGKIFVINAENDTHDDPLGFLLEKNEYKIVAK